MASISELAEWVAGIYRIEQEDPVLGGEPNEVTKAGLSNIPHQQLAKRTLWLREALLAAGLGLEVSRNVSNLDTITVSGFFNAGPGATGSPDGTASVVVIHMPGIGTSQAYQVAGRIGTTNRMWFRRKNGSEWGTWQEIRHSGNTGTAASGTLQTSATDATAGRVLTTGAFGLGAQAPSTTNLDGLLRTGFYTFSNSSSGAPSIGFGYDGVMLHIEGNGTSQRNQIAFVNDRVMHRIDDLAGSGWNGWIELATVGGTVPTDRTITAGNGLTGGGSLAANRTVTLGTPSAITATSENTVTATSHTHAITSATIRTLLADSGLGAVGTYAFLRRATANNAIQKGDSYAGSALRYAGVIDSGGDYKDQQELSDNSAPSGTWIAMGSIGSISTQYSATLFLRIA